LSEPALGNEVHDGEEQAGFVRCTMAGDRWVPIPPFVGSKPSELSEVLLKHLSE
jgi:hypothetical protein